jgi:hypothetical protein
MMVAIAFRTFGGSSAVRRMLKRKVSNRERGWQDKRPRCAAMYGCCFSMACKSHSRCAQPPRSLRFSLFLNKFNVFARCAGLPS